MLHMKNRLMLRMSLITVLLSIIVYFLERTYQLFSAPMANSMHHLDHTVAVNLTIAVNILFVLPIISWMICAYLYYWKQREHPLIPLFVTLTLTLSSFSIISGSGGSVEFHFSIFMVIAALAYYENIKLILVMTLLFAVQHIVGFFVMPELFFGAMDYSFTMLLIHAGFLILTSAATILQIVSKRAITQALEAEKNAKQEQLIQVFASVQQLTKELEQSTAAISSKSELTTRMNEEMNVSFKEVSTGLETQNESTLRIENNLQAINQMIVNTAHSSKEINTRAIETGEFVLNNEQNIRSLYEQTLIVSNSIDAATTTISTLNDSSHKIEGIIATVHEVANQTNLLALNAAIEAARAGEHGRGFSVVATEIRKLAERSSQSTQEIYTILSMIQEESTASVKQIAAGKQASTLSVNQAEETLASFVQMSKDLQKVIQLVTHLDDSIRTIESGSIEISSEISNISAITQEGVASMEQLYAQSEAQISSYKDVNYEIEQLKRLAQSLYKQMTA